MKYLIRDFIVSLVNNTGVSYVARLRQQKRGPLVRVLAFHDVPNEGWFRAIVTLCVEHYHIISPAEFAAGSFDSEKINILFTFDDGYQSWVDVVMPVLGEHQVKGLFFVTTGILAAAKDGKAAGAEFMRERLLISPKAPLAAAGVQALQSAGHTIGAHTDSHPVLAILSQTEVTQELEKAKEVLEELISEPVTAFAYPFGTARDFTGQTNELAVKNGYQQIYSAITGWYMQSATVIPRTLIERNQSLRSVRYWIEGGYDIFAGIKRLFR